MLAIEAWKPADLSYYHEKKHNETCLFSGSVFSDTSGIIPLHPRRCVEISVFFLVSDHHIYRNKHLGYLPCIGT